MLFAKLIKRFANMRRLSLLAVTAVTALTLFAAPASAQPAPDAYPRLFSNASDGYLIHPNCTGQNNTVRNCGVREMVLTVINISQLILGMVGSVALLMFIYGGIVWLTSAGNTDRVQKGKNIFIAALVGIAIIFSSSMVINFVVAALSGQQPGGDVQLFPGSNNAPQGQPLTIPGTTTQQ